MALGNCLNPVDSRGRELVEHGTTAFPIACYHDDWSNDVLPWHWHDELEFAVITEGRAVLAVGSEKHILQEGDGFFVNSGILHSCWNAGTGSCRFHSLVFHSRLVGGSLDSVFYQKYIQMLLDPSAPEYLILSPSVPWQKSILISMDAAWAQCAFEPDGYEFQVRHHLSDLIFSLWKNLHASHCTSDGQSLRNAERIKAMLSFIHENYVQEITADDIASAASISESECLRCFRNTIGTSPIRYLKQYRIWQASLQLVRTEKKIYEIASRCGFQDISYFTKSFREQMQCTPTEYRQRENRS